MTHYFAQLVKRIKARFETEFGPEIHDVPRQFELGRHAMTNEFRDGIKRVLDAEFEIALDGAPALRRLVAQAEAVQFRYGEADERAD